MELSSALALEEPIETRPRAGDETWSARRAKHKPEEKRAMAEYFVRHEFLVREGQNPELDPRETVVCVLVNQGTTPNVVVEEALKWLRERWEEHKPDITWYTTGGLVPATLRSFRQCIRSATQVFLFPGLVDPDIEAVSGPEAVAFAERLSRCFNYAFLSGHSFDISQGKIYFHYSEEMQLQRACARLYAAHKFLFFDSSKFKREGDPGYGIDELLASAESVTIYTVSSSPEKDSWIKGKFRALCGNLLEQPRSEAQMDQRLDMKALRLRIVALEGATDSTEVRGYLKKVG